VPASTAPGTLHLDPDAGVVHIRVALVESVDGSLEAGPPKSAAGRRVVSLLSMVLPDVREHLDKSVCDDPAALVFTGPKGALLRRSNFQQHWHSRSKRPVSTAFTSTTCGTPATRRPPGQAAPEGPGPAAQLHTSCTSGHHSQMTKAQVGGVQPVTWAVVSERQPTSGSPATSRSQRARRVTRISSKSRRGRRCTSSVRPRALSARRSPRSSSLR
jgi:hypothetical protein